MPKMEKISCFGAEWLRTTFHRCASAYSVHHSMCRLHGNVQFYSWEFIVRLSHLIYVSDVFCASQRQYLFVPIWSRLSQIFTAAYFNVFHFLFSTLECTLHRFATIRQEIHKKAELLLLLLRMRFTWRWDLDSFLLIHCVCRPPPLTAEQKRN